MNIKKIIYSIVLFFVIAGLIWVVKPIRDEFMGIGFKTGLVPCEIEGRTFGYNYFIQKSVSIEVIIENCNIDYH